MVDIEFKKDDIKYKKGNILVRFERLKVEVN